MVELPEFHSLWAFLLCCVEALGVKPPVPQSILYIPELVM